MILVGNTGKTDVEEDFVDHLWVVVIEPLRDLGMAWMFGVGPGVEYAIEARYPAAVFGRSGLFAGDVAGI